MSFYFSILKKATENFPQILARKEEVAHIEIIAGHCVTNGAKKGKHNV